MTFDLLGLLSWISSGGLVTLFALGGPRWLLICSIVTGIAGGILHSIKTRQIATDAHAIATIAAAYPPATQEGQPK